MKQVTSSFGDHWHHCPSPQPLVVNPLLLITASSSSFLSQLSLLLSYHRCSLLLITVLGCIERNVYLINQLIARAFNYNCVPLR